MLVGQQLGPFLIDMELGAGAMGAVYRGKYVKTGQVVAIKVMAPGLGSSTALARFEREGEILKQLNHPNIVRLFGVGKSQGVRYYAMEYIQGESLDKVMARRDRMSWEEVVDLGLQLCSALQHAHEHGIVHRDLKPSNLMILADGTLKLTDFGIAKALEVTQLTSANCTVGTAAYMSPEQCKGEVHLTHKSDLYSLGVVFYELITGRRPFETDNAMEMFLKHVHDTPKRPSQIVLDMPVWMDNLICQMLEKAPEHRPVDAAMVASVLTSIQEKVEAQQSAGIDAVQARGGDRRRIKREPISEEDKAVARSLTGKKGRKKPKKAFYELIWLRAIGLLLLLAMVVTGIVILSRPPSAERLYQEADRLLQSDKQEMRDRAHADRGPIQTYLRLYGKRDDAMTEKVRQWAEDHEVAFYEKLLDRHVRHVKEKKGFAVEAQGDSQQQAFDAALAEYDGDRDRAAKLWQQVFDKEGTVRIGLVARRHLAALNSIDEEIKRLGVLRREVRDRFREPELDELRQRAFLAYRQELLGDWVGARRGYERLREEAGKDPAQRFWQVLAAVKSKQLKDALAEKPLDNKKRIELVHHLAAETEKGTGSLLDRRLVAHEIVLLYDKDDEMADAVARAKAVVKKLDEALGRSSGGS
jgi:serine/threonine-protein kinase